VRAVEAGKAPPVAWLFAGLFGGLGRLEGERNEPSGSLIHLGLFLGAELEVSRHLALGARASVSNWDSSESLLLGYQRFRVDLGLAPSVHFPLSLPYGAPDQQRRYPRPWIYLSVPFGMSFPLIKSPSHRAIDEHVDGRRGWYAGLGAGVTLTRGAWGLFIGGEYARHAAGTTSRLTPREQGAATVVERHDFVDHQLIAVGGAMLGI